MQNVDLRDPDLYIDRVPYELFAELRRTDPVYWNAEHDDVGFWAVLRYADIAQISKNPKVFSSAYENGGHRIFNENEVAVANTGSNAIGVPFISTDPPLHKYYRAMVQPGLSLTEVRKMEPRLQQQVSALLDRIEDLPGEFDFVDLLAAPFPITTLAELFGVPASDSDRLYGWSNAMVGEDDPSIRVSPDQAAQTLGEMIEYATWIYEDRKKTPQADILSMLANGNLDGAPLSLADFLGTFILLLVGGNETTRNSISQGMIAFTEYRDQWQKISEHPELLPMAAREIVRWATPVLHMRRTATVDAEIGGKQINKGDKVVLWYASANRDDSVYQDPDKFSVTRDEPLHLGFGTGVHTCVGNRLAEVQIRIVFENLVKRFPNMHISGPGRRLRSNFINGILNLPARTA